ncbi:hypothetical protein [Nonomuraea sp. NPDC002799]
MPLIDPKLNALVRAADQHARHLLAQAELQLDMRARQLSVLRNTYPGWSIAYEPDSTGRMWWTARLSHQITLEEATAGVLPFIQCQDAIALATTLAWQAALIHNAQSRQGPR